MDGDEVFALIVSLALVIPGGWRWYVPLLRVTPMARTSGQRVVLAVWPVGCLALLAAVLMHWADAEVRGHAEYILLFMAAGGAWLGATAEYTALLGMSVREGAIERRNIATVAVVCGAMLGATLCFAGGNIGSGPTIWTTFGPAALATVAWGGLWLIFELLSGARDSVMLDRDTASGVRVAGFLIAAGLVLGRAVAGDWESAARTVEDFIHQGWPALVLAAAAIVIHLIFRPTSQTPRRSALLCGVLPAVLFIAAAMLWVVALGRWT